jgi:3' terminal RNA ribose 2'-O-methyltransferase Hen1
MLMTITCEGPHAQDFGFLIHKNPASVFERQLAFGRVTLFYTENMPERASVALVFDIDPVSLVRDGNRAAALEQYVNDRPYVASSFTSVAIREAFSSALAGKSKDRPDLVARPLPLRASVPAVHARGDVAIVERLFSPLGYEVAVQHRQLDERYPAWGDGELVSLEIAGVQTVHDLLSHLYVLLPVLDAAKHYYIGEDEVQKLLAHGAGWLEHHPEKTLIANRYLKHRRGLVHDALSQLTIGQPEVDADEQAREDALEAAPRLHDARIAAVVAALRDAMPPVRRIVDMGCGEGRLLQALLPDPAFTELVGVDVSTAMLAIAEKRLNLERLPIAVRDRVRLIQGSVLYRDQRLEGYDAVTLVEVIEHIAEERLDVVRAVVFGRLRPRMVVMTTPNAEYNVRFPTLPSGRTRHADHRFEWTRDQFMTWCEEAIPFGYSVRHGHVGLEDPVVGPPTQMAIFERDTLS